MDLETQHGDIRDVKKDIRDVKSFLESDLNDSDRKYTDEEILQYVTKENIGELEIIHLNKLIQRGYRNVIWECLSADTFLEFQNSDKIEILFNLLEDYTSDYFIQLFPIEIEGEINPNLAKIDDGVIAALEKHSTSRRELVNIFRARESIMLSKIHRIVLATKRLLNKILRENSI